MLHGGCTHVCIGRCPRAGSAPQRRRPHQPPAPHLLAGTPIPNVKQPACGQGGAGPAQVSNHCQHAGGAAAGGAARASPPKPPLHRAAPRRRTHAAWPAQPTAAQGRVQDKGSVCRGARQAPWPCGPGAGRPARAELHARMSAAPECAGAKLRGPSLPPPRWLRQAAFRWLLRCRGGLRLHSCFAAGSAGQPRFGLPRPGAAACGAAPPHASPLDNLVDLSDVHSCRRPGPPSPQRAGAGEAAAVACRPISTFGASTSGGVVGAESMPGGGEGTTRGHDGGDDAPPVAVWFVCACDALLGPGLHRGPTERGWT